MAYYDEAYRGINHINLYSLLMSAYRYCVFQSRWPRDAWDEAGLTLIVRAEALNGNPLAIMLLDRYERERTLNLTND